MAFRLVLLVVVVFFSFVVFLNFSQSGLISLFSLFTTSLSAYFGIALATFATLSQWLCIPGCYSPQCWVIDSHYIPGYNLSRCRSTGLQLFPLYVVLH